MSDRAPLQHPLKEKENKQTNNFSSRKFQKQIPENTVQMHKKQKLIAQAAAACNGDDILLSTLQDTNATKAFMNLSNLCEKKKVILFHPSTHSVTDAKHSTEHDSMPKCPQKSQ